VAGDGERQAAAGIGVRVQEVVRPPGGSAGRPPEPVPAEGVRATPNLRRRPGSGRPTGRARGRDSPLRAPSWIGS